ncbi:LOW QUALITY PROTEIN: hypothetical protein HID58_085608, partial [Brassica napus]
KDGLDNLVKKMTSIRNFVDNHNPTCRVKLGDFAIPKFKISFGFLRRSFEECVSNALYHKACVEIDEEGAEAAATTFGTPTSYTKNRVNIVADHPVLFLIRENTTGAVLFVGQIVDPSKSS